MTEEEAIRKTVEAHPLDDTPRLVYSDWLEEHGHREEAAAHRYMVNPTPDIPQEAANHLAAATASKIAHSLSDRLRAGTDRTTTEMNAGWWSNHAARPKGFGGGESIEQRHLEAATLHLEAAQDKNHVTEEDRALHRKAAQFHQAAADLHREARKRYRHATYPS